MNDTATTLDPALYERWRATPLGALTETLESRVVFELTGPLRGKRVLDVGTGDGTYAIEAAARGADVTALDASPEMLQAAHARAERRGVSIKLCEGDVQSLPFEAERFDVVLAITVLCSVKDVGAAFRELARVLAPTGTIVIGELGRWSTWAAKRRLQSVARESFWSSVHFWTVRELNRRLSDAGLKIEATRGAIYFPPIGSVARLMARFDPVLARLGTLGAAFLCVVARKR
jgi:2-polyprenyl-3-methyl-5-hydroxy-6-metoxy-1,4-benzoquinol methylase